eukprot:scaffold240369_cov33-Attheya_sp.AAC.1
MDSTWGDIYEYLACKEYRHSQAQSKMPTVWKRSMMFGRCMVELSEEYFVLPNAELPDPQTVTQIFKESIIARVPFQLTADILAHVDPEDLPDNNLEWSSNLTNVVRTTTRNIIGPATQLDAIPEYALELAFMPESLQGLVELGTYFHDLFKDWRTSREPLFVIMRHYASPLAHEMHIPKKFDTLDPLDYLAEVHDLGTFQQRTTNAAFAHRKKALTTDPEPFLGCTDVYDYTSDPIPDSMEDDDPMDTPLPPPNPSQWTWQKDITTANIRRALPSLFHCSAMEAHLITAPRSQPHHRLSAGLFHIALARRLRLPVHTYRKRCKCKKWLDIFGDHYFDCHKMIPKTGLHNKVRDGFFYVFSDIAAHTSVMAGPQDVFHEPHNIRGGQNPEIKLF